MNPRRYSMPAIREGGVNVTPLIDVVMCLIIFFMLAAKIGVSSGVDRTVAIPKSVLGTRIAKDLGNTLTVNVRPGAGNEPSVTALVKGQFAELKLKDAASGH